MAEQDPHPLTRKELSEFLPTQRAIRAFEKLFDLIPTDLNDLLTRIGILENPPVLFVFANTEITTDAYAIVAENDGITLTLPKCSEEIKGRIWTFTLNVEGSITVNTQGGDTFTTPNNPTETSLILNRRGTTIGLRCISDNEWGFV